MPIRSLHVRRHGPHEFTPNREHHCNIWQGRFPEEDTAEDGYAETAPARSFKPNGFGLYNMMGNAWDWVADWFDPVCPKPAPAENPTGREKVIRGGSFLCHASHCNRYRNSARTKVTPNSSTCHLSFRCAMSP
jgi:formylglycine-generating enzyme required for sulfatase activity